MPASDTFREWQRTSTRFYNSLIVRALPLPRLRIKRYYFSHNILLLARLLPTLPCFDSKANTIKNNIL